VSLGERKIGPVGREFMIGDVRCHGVRLCEPCRVMEVYAPRPLLRALVHRRGLRADILEDGEVHVGGRISGCEYPSPA
jgi:MOSC domain-containing protein YiiM